GGIADQVVLCGIEHADVVAHELQHVFVAGDDIYGIASADSLVRQRTDYVVSFESGLLQNGNSVGIERSPDVWQLLREIVRHLGPVRLVPTIGDFLIRLRLAIETL